MRESGIVCVCVCMCVPLCVCTRACVSVCVNVSFQAIPLSLHSKVYLTFRGKEQLFVSLTEILKSTSG